LRTSSPIYTRAVLEQQIRPATTERPSPDPKGGRTEILGVPVDAIGREEALSRCERVLAQGAAAQPLQIVTLNPEMVMRARRDQAFREVVQRSGLVLADGAGISWAAGWLGHPLPERVPGVELLLELCSLCARRGWSVYLLGAAPGVAEEAASRLKAEIPGLIVAGCGSGSPEDAESTAAEIRARGARLVAVAFGAPRQELFLDRYLAATGCAVGIGVGGSFDYISGRVRRAPAIMRKRGFEWLFRLARQPWRLPRMLRAAPFFLLVMRQRRVVAH
jgi:N-acetylglucosaminyldiphosphoundecaprenol N-acetyl-beta-D-mannosaminyltransferase